MAERTPTSPVDFLVPDLGEGLEDVTVVEWLVAVGDRVELNQPLCTVETAKAEVDVPSPHAGLVVALGGEEGETLPVGSLLARLDPEAGRDHGRARPSGGTDDDAGTGAGATLVGYGYDERLDRSRRPAATDSGGRPPATSRPATSPSSAPSAPASPSRQPPGYALRPRAKPPVRRLARQLGVDLGAVAPGRGPDGIVTRADVETAAAAIADAPATTTAVAPARAGGHDATAPRRGTTIPVRGVRARVAERMVRSTATIPTASCTVVADCTRLLEVRTALNGFADRRGLEPLITPFALLAHQVVHALAATPVLNATFDDTVPEIRVHEAVHLGIATATDRGLVVTVVRHAETRGMHDLAAELARLTADARAGRARPDELTGSTFTISNFGALGIDQGTPIVNPPEAAILGVGAVRPRPHVVDEQVVARSTVSLTLVFDHRVCDGSEAGRFLNDLREVIEAPELALLGP